MRKFVSTSYDGCDYITAGKLYEVVREYGVSFGYDIVGDHGHLVFTSFRGLNRNDWTVHNVGTLAEIGAKVGDVVGSVARGIEWSHKLTEEMGFIDPVYYLIPHTTDDTPKTWGGMTAAEKGDLLLWKHDGGEVQWAKSEQSVWRGCPNAVGKYDDYAYRKKPAEPMREVVKSYWCKKWGMRLGSPSHDTTHRITFETVDGEPDVTTAKMEKLQC